MATAVELRKRVLAMHSALLTDRSSWDAQWEEIGKQVLPRSVRLTTSDNNKGSKRYNKIYDNTGVRALRVLAAGMMSGVSSPARPWFKLTIKDKKLSNRDEVKLWLADVAQAIRDVFMRSNVYRALHSSYEELGAFGTAVAIIDEDDDSVLHLHTLTLGEYALATDNKGRVRTMVRKLPMTVEQLVDSFGKEACSLSVQMAYNSGNLYQRFDVIHAIFPRRDYDPLKMDAKNKPFASVYIELTGEEGQVLRESGYSRFPVLSPRWVTAGTDTYGTSPGMEALGDCKQLQHEQLRKAEAIDYQVQPPLQAPTSLARAGLDGRPGGRTYADLASPSGGIRSMFEVNLDLNALREDIMDVRQRINSAFYADLFLMLANDTRSGITATEVAERHEEKLLMLGPVLERLHDELLAPLVEYTFYRLADMRDANGDPVLPPLPSALRDVDIGIEFVSVLAQAQRAVGAASIDRWIATIGSIASMRPEVVDKLNADELADTYADILGVDPKLVSPDDQVEQARNARAQQAAQVQQAQLAEQQAKAAQTLSNTNTTDRNGLTDMMGQLSGYNTPGVTG